MLRRALAGLLVCAGLGTESVRRQSITFTTVATGLDEPVAIAVLPGDGVLVAERGGTIKRVRHGEVDDVPFAETDVYAFSECGLLGMTLDPDFERNGFVYVFATVSPDEQQIIRLIAGAPGTEAPHVIRGNLPTNGSVHNGGAIGFGKDGMLYFAVGDTGTDTAAQVMHTLTGKVCRIRTDGTVPPDNPFKTPTGTPRAVWALGFRNPFRMAFAADGRVMVGDVGSSGDGRAEEINFIQAGSNYGWPAVEGAGDDAADGFAPPALAYHDEGASIAGCAFIGDDLFHVDFASGGVYRARTVGQDVVAHDQVASIDGGPVGLAAGDGGLYACTFFGGTLLHATVAGAAPSNDAEGSPPAPDAVAPGVAASPCGSGMPAGIGLLVAGMTALRSLQPIRRRRVRYATCMCVQRTRLPG